MHVLANRRVSAPHLRLLPVISGLMLTVATAAAAVELRPVVECSQPTGSSWCALTGPSLSADGHCVVFAHEESSPPTFQWWPYLVMTGIDGTSCSGTFYVANARSPAWSPDGTRVAYAIGTFAVESSGIWTRSVGNPLVPPPTHVASGAFADPAWSLDGSSIACVGVGGIYIVPSGGGTPMMVAGGGHFPSWGPNLQFVFERGGDLWIRSSDGSERQLTQTPEFDGEPAWSPQGMWIAYASDRNGNRNIWVIAASGGTPVQVTSGPAYDAHPSWSAQGDRLVFASSLNDQYTIWLATNLPDWTIGVQQKSWGEMKQLFR